MCRLTHIHIVERIGIEDGTSRDVLAGKHALVDDLMHTNAANSSCLCLQYQYC